jgi:hypothetical protein
MTGDDKTLESLLEGAKLGAQTGATLVPASIARPLHVFMKLIEARPDFEPVIAGKLGEIAKAGVEAHDTLCVMEAVLGRPITRSEWESIGKRG